MSVSVSVLWNSSFIGDTPRDQFIERKKMVPLNLSLSPENAEMSIGKDGIPREQFPRNFLAANVTRKSLTCYEDVVRIGRVKRMLQGCYEKTAVVEFSLKSLRRTVSRSPYTSLVFARGDCVCLAKMFMRYP